MKGYIKKHSIGFWLRCFLFILLSFFIIVLLIFQNIARKNLVEQTIENVSEKIQIYATEVDNSLYALESYLYQTFKDSEAVVRLETGGGDLQMYQAKRDVLDKITAIQSWDAAIHSIIFLSVSKEEPIVLMESGTYGNYPVQLVLKDELLEYIQGTGNGALLKSNGYLLTEINSEAYVVRVYKVRNSYIGISLMGKNLLEPLIRTDSEDAIAFLADTTGRIVQSTQPMPSQINPEDNGRFMHISSGNYLQTNYLSKDGDFYYGMLTKSGQIEQQSKTLLFLIIITFIMMMIFTAMILGIFGRFIGKPMIQLAASMGKVGEGQWDVPVSYETYVKENDILLERFNEMVSEIKNLKLSNYEYELAVQKSQLQYLQMQVNPHFYLNALNIIYSLAEINDFEMIQKMTLSLVKYSRYMFRDATQLVTLREELEHVDNYLQIQQMRFSNRIEYICRAEDDLMLVLVPPFIIQSFVENSIKYAINFDQHNRLSVIARKVLVEGKDFMQLEIRDNGTGYSEEVLEIIKNGTKSEDETKNVGIRNVMQRLSLIYGERATVHLANDDGAVTTINIPMIKKWGSDNERI